MDGVDRRLSAARLLPWPRALSNARPGRGI